MDYKIFTLLVAGLQVPIKDNHIPTLNFFAAPTNHRGARRDPDRKQPAMQRSAPVAV
jgi:hypothetical protein